jgi:NADPH-dependent 2,4-dienoyl-CoA reductase/sulfur reductase-like enzyme/pSer/pThr/pTyr-binding forkhead associated (FHA) protein
MSKQKISYLIIGNGITGVIAAEVLRAEDPQASIGVIADDPYPVYYRPALKDYLGGHVPTEKLRARPANFYQNANVVFLPDRVVGLHSENHAVVLQSQKQITYNKLLLANGASPARLKCPGNDLRGVTTLRTVIDYQNLLERLSTVSRVVISGSGTLAIETAESLRQRGLEVTHLLRSTTLWSEVLDTTASDLVLQQERRAGVEVCQEEEIIEITGTRGEVSSVVTSLGRRIACQMVIVAIGIEPNIKPWQLGGVDCGRGVRVDDMLCTNLPDVYAAGDLIEINDTLTGRTRVLGQWYPAIQQARRAAYSMLGRSEELQPFRTDIFYNATFLYGLDFASAGLTITPEQSGYQELIADPQPRNYRKIILKDDIPVGLLMLGDRKQALVLKRAIDHRVNLRSIASRLFSPDFNLRAWLDEQGVPPSLLAVGSKLALSSQQVEKGVGVEQASPLPRSDKTVTPKTPVSLQGVGGGRASPLLDIQDETREEKAQSLIVSGEGGLTPAKIGRGEELMADTQNLAAAEYEALLVQVVDPTLRLYIPETPLNKKQALRIGRQAGVNLLLDEVSISRQHAEISYAAGRYLLQDLGSTNGTFVNEQQIDVSRTYVLQENDILRFGDIVRLKFLLRVLSYRSRIQSIPFQDESVQRNARSRNTDPPLVNGIDDSYTRQEQRIAEQAVLNFDGTLSTPGASQPVPASIVAQLQKASALIVMPEGSMQNTVPPEVYFLNPGKRTTIGREKNNDIVLTDLTVSRYHAEVFLDADGFYIRDLKSSYGVYVNQTKVTESYPLSHSDYIKLGSTRIFFIDLQAGSERTKKGIEVPAPPSASNPAFTQGMQVRPVADNTRRPSPGPADRRVIQNDALQQARVVMCPRCGIANIRSARFCASCSMSLA